MKKLFNIFAVICLISLTAIVLVSCMNHGGDYTPRNSPSVIAKYMATINYQQDVIEIKSDGTWIEIYGESERIDYTSGTYSIISGNETNGTIHINVTFSRINTVPVGTTSDITITNGQFTFNGNTYTKI